MAKKSNKTPQFKLNLPKKSKKQDIKAVNKSVHAQLKQVFVALKRLESPQKNNIEKPEENERNLSVEMESDKTVKSFDFKVSLRKNSFFISNNDRRDSMNSNENGEFNIAVKIFGEQCMLNCNQITKDHFNKDDEINNSKEINSNRITKTSKRIAARNIIKREKKNKIAVRNTASSLQSSINSSWKNEKKNQINSNAIKVNDICLAKMRSYCPWPCKVINICNKRINVLFFGNPAETGKNI